MKYIMTPKFRTREIVNDAITKNWIYFQDRALDMGRKLHAYMQDYINSHKHRRGGSGKLAKAITFDILATAPAKVHWGIGNIQVLNRIAPYWYVVNYGKTTSGQRYVPNYGNFVPGWFRGGDNRPDATEKGKSPATSKNKPASAIELNSEGKESRETKI